MVRFLKTTPALDKTAAGDFIGKDEAYNKAILMQYLDEYDFTGVYFVKALRMLLSGFRISGEGQVVDRMMEKFGEKFAADNITNPNPLNESMGAECLYLLSFATMMCQTSLHNPNVKKGTMTLPDFQKMLRGINAGGNLTEAFVTGVYETVEREPFTLNEDDDARMKEAAAQAKNQKQKQELFTMEGQGLIKRGMTEINNAMHSKFVDVEGP